MRDELKSANLQADEMLSDTQQGTSASESNSSAGAAGATSRQALPPEERKRLVEEFKRVFINYPLGATALKSIDRLIRYGNVGAEVNSPSRCLLFTGPSGSGKSAILRRAVAEFKAKSADRTPPLLVKLPERCSPKNLAEEMLRALGMPDDLIKTRENEKREFWQVNMLLAAKQVPAVFLDEFDHLIDSENNKVMRRAANSVKTLLNERICPYLLTGTDDAITVYNANVQLKRRSMGHAILRAFSWSVPSEADLWRAIIHELDRHVPLNALSDLARVDTAYRIYYVARGLLGRAVDFIVMAIELALDCGEGKLTKPILAEAAEQWRNRSNPDWLNPFTIDNVPRTLPNDDEDAGTPTRLHRRNRQARPNDILRG